MHLLTSTSVYMLFPLSGVTSSGRKMQLVPHIPALPHSSPPCTLIVPHTSSSHHTSPHQTAAPGWAGLPPSAVSPGPLSGASCAPLVTLPHAPPVLSEGLLCPPPHSHPCLARPGVQQAQDSCRLGPRVPGWGPHLCPLHPAGAAPPRARVGVVRTAGAGAAAGLGTPPPAVTPAPLRGGGLAPPPDHHPGGVALLVLSF